LNDSTSMPTAATTPKGRARLSLLKKGLTEEFKPYWTDGVDSFLKQANEGLGTGGAGTANPERLDSWFSVRERLLPNTGKPALRTSAQPGNEDPKTVLRTKRIRVYPKQDLQKLLLFFEATRYYFNKTVTLLKKKGVKASRFEHQVALLNEQEEWIDDFVEPKHKRFEGVYYKVKQMAIEDACAAVKAAKKKYLKTKQFQEVGYRRRKDRRDSFYVDKQSVKPTGIFVRSFSNWHITEEIGEVKYDCRMIHDRGRFWLCVPYDKPVRRSDNQGRIIALDPGVRTFLTGFHDGGFIHFGENDMQVVFKELYVMDRMISKRDRNCQKAIDRRRWRVKNLITEMHCQLASWLTSSFGTVVIPPFAASAKMMSKLRSKTCRALLTWSHATFLNRLKNKAVENGCTVVVQPEAYTSKTCSACGKIRNIGSAKSWTCRGCGVTWDRDENAARGILLRALIDQSSYFSNEVGVMSIQGCC